MFGLKEKPQPPSEVKIKLDEVAKKTLRDILASKPVSTATAIALATLITTICSQEKTTTPNPPETPAPEKILETATPTLTITPTSKIAIETVVPTATPELKNAVSIEQISQIISGRESTEVLPLESIPVSIQLTDNTQIFFREPDDRFTTMLPPTKEYSVRELDQIVTALTIFKNNPYLAQNLPAQIHFSLVMGIPQMSYENYDLYGLTQKLNYPTKKDKPLILGLLWVGDHYADDSSPGVALLIHELTHCVAHQQRHLYGTPEILTNYLHTPNVTLGRYPEEAMADSLGRTLTGSGSPAENAFWQNFLDLPSQQTQ